MIPLAFKIHLQEPLLVTALEGDPNSAVSLPFIPGSALRGAFIARYLQKNPTVDLSVDHKARALFLDGTTCYLNAYPLSSACGVRMLPTPRSWKVNKGAADAIVYDLSVDASPEVDEDWQPQAIAEPFYYLKDRYVELCLPEKQVTVHMQRDRKKGRSTEKEGAVFRYEALAPRQTFVGAVLCPDTATADVIESLLETETLFLGGSQSAGYGLVDVSIDSCVELQEVPSQFQRAIGAGESFTVTLLSDAVLRDSRGHYTGFLSSEILGERIGTDLTLLRERTYAKVGVVGGFNRKWGLPLPQTPVACSGSVFTFQAKGQIQAEQLADLLEYGIGERRAEGFGRLALNWHAEYGKLQIEDSLGRKRQKPERPVLKSESAGLAQQMATRLLRSRLEARLSAQIKHLPIEGAIKNHQLSGLRTLVRTASVAGDVGPIRARLDQMKKTGRDQFESAKIDGASLWDWLDEVLQEVQREDAAGIWKRLCRTSFDQEKLPTIGGVHAHWDGTLAREYVLRLVDGVLSQKLAERRKENHG